MSPGMRKLALTVHLILSVGWIGAVLAYLALDVFAVTSTDTEIARGSWIAMELTARYVIVPLALASLATGLIMALGTPWGLFGHYWVLISFALTVLATVVLVAHLSDISAMAAGPHSSGGQGHGSSTASGARSDFLHAGGGLVVLVFITALNTYKPRGLTPYGWRQHIASRGTAARSATPD